MMNKTKTLALSAAFAASAVFSTTSSAFIVDFTDAVKWGNPSGSNIEYSADTVDFTYPGGFEVKVKSSPNANNETDVFWEQQDGFGVKGPGDNSNWDDDIENFNGTGNVVEILRVFFSTDALVSRIRIADFLGNGEYNAEDGNGWVAFGPGSNTNGPGDWFAISPAFATNKISFRALGGVGNSFQVSGLDVAPVPLPPAVWLLGSAMVFLFRKRQVS